MKFISDTDKAWLAGFIDGEGYIGIVRAKENINSQQSDTWQYHPWVIVTNTSLNIIEYLQGAIRTHNRASLSPTRGHKHGYQAKITKLEDTIHLLESISPSL